MTDGFPSRQGDPAVGEFVRRLEEAVSEIRELRRTMEATYLRQDVYRAEQRGMNGLLKDVRADLDAIVEQQRANRRLAVSGIVFPVLSGLILALLLLVLLPTGPT